METALFWIAWGLISFWALRTFYFTYDKGKLQKLRKTSFGISLAVLILTFLPWLPPSLGGTTGLDIALEGNILSILFVILLVVSIALFLAKDASLLRLASVAMVTNTILLFVIMYTLRPGTFALTRYDIAPIVAALFLLVGDVVVLLLWQQLQLKGRKLK